MSGVEEWASESEVLELLSRLPMAAYRCDEDGLITFFNSAAERLWGRTPRLLGADDRFCGSPQLLRPDGTPIELARCFMALAIRERRAYLGQAIVVGRPDGSRAHTIAAATPVVVAGRPAGAVGLMLEMPAPSAFDEDAMASAFETWFARDREGALFTRFNGTILRVNEAARQITGFSAAELEAMGRDRLFGSDPSTGRTPLWVLQEQSAIFRQQASIARGDGSRAVVEVHSIALSRGPDGGTALLVFRDVSAQVEAARASQIAERLETMTQLAAGIAHKFNNLLLVLSASGAFIRRLTTDKLVGEEVDRIQSTIDRAAELTRQLSTLGATQSTHPRPLEVNAAVARVVVMLRRGLREDVHLRERYAEDAGSILFADADLEHIVLTLAVRAAESLRDGGELTIATTELHREAGDPTRALLRPGSYVSLVVSAVPAGAVPDAATGPGSSMGEEASFDAASALLRRSGGALFMQALAGGIRFEACIPRLEPIAVDAGPAGPVAELRGQEKILVVDDDDLVRHAVARAFALYGYKVRQAIDGAQALETLEREAIDLMVTDVVMPTMGGRELLERARPLYPRLLFIVLTGYGSTEAIRRAVALGARYLSKPSAPRELVATARALLDARAASAARHAT